MKGSEFVASLPEVPGLARERAIFDAVTAGNARFEWATIVSKAGGHTAEIDVSKDALAIGDEADWVRVNVTHTTAQQIADRLGAVLPTTRICDLIFEQAEVRLTPCLQRDYASMAKTARMLLHHEQVEGKRAGRAGLLSTVGKDWVLTNRLQGLPQQAANYGWHDAHAPNGRLWQTLGLVHNRFHVDYSQVLRLVRRTMRVDGVERDIVEVLRDPGLAGLVSSEGVIALWRLAAVPEGGPLGEGPVPRVDPVRAIRRTLRRGMVGFDVADWQDVVKVKPDCNFGPKTEAATRAWQAANGLAADGVVGPRSRQKAGLEPAPAGEGAEAAYKFVRARNFKPAARAAIDLIVVHTMEAAEKPTTAENVAAWFAGPGAPMASAHYCVDVDSIVQCVRDQDVAYHAPGANHNGIGIEHAGYASQSAEDWADDYSETMLRRSAALTARLCANYKVPIVFRDAKALLEGKRGITTHRAVSAAFKKSDHTDPGSDFPMDHYLELVREFYED